MSDQTPVPCGSKKQVSCSSCPSHDICHALGLIIDAPPEPEEER